jgi:hypothetical protein
MKLNRQPPNNLIPLPKDTTEQGLFYLFILSLPLILIYAYLLKENREIPPSLTGLMGSTISPLVYTIFPKLLHR